MLAHKIYYQLKPFIPRSLQITLRRSVVLRKRELYKHVWPIEENAGRVPEGWTGWPDGKRFALVLTHDVETVEGQERCAQLAALEESFGFRSSFNFVAEEYNVSASLRKSLIERGFEVGVHGLYHGNNPFRSKTIFQEQAVRINKYLKDWGCVGYRCPCMYHNLEWIGELDIEYDSSTFDTDPFEPQPDGVGTIFPFWVPAARNVFLTRNSEPLPVRQAGVSRNSKPETVLRNGFIELPYTLPQDHTLFVIMRERDTAIWKKKLDWIVERGGMVLMIVHPDYTNFGRQVQAREEYPASYFTKFLEYIKEKYEGQYWHVLPKDIARFWAKKFHSKKA